jgi:S-adenosylmethionine hydrolase
MHIITLTTDFGIRDWFVGTMKGVVLGINPRAVIVDITHEINSGDIRAGAFSLMAAYRYFPRGTVHVAVVDPGVGSKRQAIAVQTSKYVFVGPDNGVLSWAVAREKIKSIRRLDGPKYFLKSISRTFHGRDIFAPVAAHLSRGLVLAKVGRELKEFVRIPWSEPIQRSSGICGEIVHIDRFGNAITNIGAELVGKGRKRVCEVGGRHNLRCILAPFYGAVPANSPVAVMSSSGLLEIAVNGGSAAERFGLEIGDKVIAQLI